MGVLAKRACSVLWPVPLPLGGLCGQRVPRVLLWAWEAWVSHSDPPFTRSRHVGAPSFGCLLRKFWGWGPTWA